MLFKVYVMLFEDLINKISLKLEEKLSDRFLISIQESLLRAGLFALASHFIAEILMIIIVLLLLFVSVSLIFSFSLLIAVMLAISIPIAISVAYVMIKTEQRAMQIENSIPDFLRQLASMLRVGLSLENALLDLSKHGNGPLYDELRRVVVEVRMGRGFDEAFENMAVRLNSQTDIEEGAEIICYDVCDVFSLGFCSCSSFCTWNGWGLFIIHDGSWKGEYDVPGCSFGG